MVRFTEPAGDDASGSPRGPAPWQPPPRLGATARPPLAINTAPPLTDSGGDPFDSSDPRGQGAGSDASPGSEVYAPPPEPVVLAATPRAGQPSYLRAHLQVHHSYGLQLAGLQQLLAVPMRCDVTWLTVPRPPANQGQNTACLIVIWFTCRLQRCWQRSARSRRRNGSVLDAHRLRFGVCSAR